MKLKLCVCLAMAGVAVLVTQAVAAPVYTPFLSVDVNGGNPVGPTAAGYTGWAVTSGGLTPWALSGGGAGIDLLAVPTSEGNVNINMKGIAPGGSRDTRDRGANAGALSDVYREITFASRGYDGFGRHYIRLAISGLTPNGVYEFTMYNREPFNGSLKDNPDPNSDAVGVCSNCSSWQAWSDLDELGVDGPDAWMDANVGAGAFYQPTWEADPNSATNGTYKNPIPTITRVRISGPDSADPYFFSDSFFTRADGAGVVTVYGWADPQGYSATQTVSLINGFELGIIPEPASMMLACIGLAGIAGVRRRK